ncbi:hypothetical protein V8G54_023367 [Vigna mungo]|uniref:Sulfite exporter TauE/SafE family protein n=1 Tax=Vigna mungo TaxID=3915 RepID=A0AAQ3N4R8_VIGMU
MSCYFLILLDIATAKDVAHYIQTEDPVKDDTKELKKKVSMVDNIRWKDLGHLFVVWIMILVLEIGKNYTTTCSGAYWAVNLLQIPIVVGMSSYQTVRLYKGKRSIASKGDQQPHWRVWQLIVFCCCGTLADLLGLCGGFISAPLFLGIGIPPQVASATSILVMAFSASMVVVEYYLLKCFPVPYDVATATSLVGQYLVRKVVAILGRASVIIFILTFTLCVSAVLLGGVGVAHMIQKIERKDNMGFGNLCMYTAKNYAS